MPQAPQPSVLDRIFQKFQARKTGNQNQQEAKEIDDPANPGKKIPNPKWKDPSTNNQNSNDPMSLYSGLFDTPTHDGVKQPPKLALSREKIAEAAGKINFMDGLPKELGEALAAEGGLTVENISALVNHVGRSAYSRAIEHGTHLTDQFVSMRSAHDSEQIPGQVRTHLAKSKARGDVDDPAVREHLDMISERISQRYPDATEEEVAQMTHEYFGTIYKKVNPKAFEGTQGDRSTPQGEDFNFDGYLQGTDNLQQASQPAPAKAA